MKWRTAWYSATDRQVFEPGDNQSLWLPPSQETSKFRGAGFPALGLGPLGGPTDTTESGIE
jgi:hypothetical protein